MKLQNKISTSVSVSLYTEFYSMVLQITIRVSKLGKSQKKLFIHKMYHFYIIFLWFNNLFQTTLLLLLFGLFVCFVWLVGFLVLPWLS